MPIRVLVVDDPELAGAIRREWQALAEREVAVRQMSGQEILETSSRRLGVDAVVYPSGLLGELAEREWIQPLSAEISKLPKSLERMQFAYLNSGFHPPWGYDPYRVFVYTSLQEKATQISHANTGRRCADYEPKLAAVRARVASEEARHYAFYRQVFAAILERDPDRALDSAAYVLPRLEMPGASMPNFQAIADVERRLGIYGPRDYLRIVEDQIRFWKIAELTGLGEAGRRAQEKILAIPDRLRRTAEIIERRRRAKSRRRAGRCASG